MIVRVFLLSAFWLLRNLNYQKLNQSDFKYLSFKADHQLKGIRLKRVQRIAWDYRETEADREFSPASFTRKHPEIPPETRA
jgi:hypothetical protein